MPTPNLDLADRALAYVIAHPDEHKQWDWRCKSGMCFAGIASVLNGATWLTGPSGEGSPACDASGRELSGNLRDPRGELEVAAYVRVTPAEKAAVMAATDGYDGELIFSDAVHVRLYAQYALGLTDIQADALFDAYNSVDDLTRIVGRFHRQVAPTRG